MSDLGRAAQEAPGISSADPAEARKTPLPQNLGAESKKVTSEKTDPEEGKGIGLFLSAQLLVKQIIDFFFFPKAVITLLATVSTD